MWISGMPDFKKQYQITGITKQHKKTYSFKYAKNHPSNDEDFSYKNAVLIISLHDFEIMVQMNKNTPEKTLKLFSCLNILNSDLFMDLTNYAQTSQKPFWNTVYHQIKDRTSSFKFKELYKTAEFYQDPDGNFGKWKFVTLS